MSRITLHLRKQARSREADTNLQAYSLGTFNTIDMIRSRLRFGGTRETGACQSADPRLTVNVQESMVVHDDDGNLVLSEPSSPALKAKTVGGGGGGGDGWYEMHPPTAVRLPERARRDRNPELKFVV